MGFPANPAGFFSGYGVSCLSKCGFPSSRRPETRGGNPVSGTAPPSGGAQTINLVLTGQPEIMN
jgi:hypothetical protein